ncbi:hypothetical protein EV648_1141, partial [Kribbella sp. VKM Ac-2568]
MGTSWRRVVAVGCSVGLLLGPLVVAGPARAQDRPARPV